MTDPAVKRPYDAFAYTFILTDAQIIATLGSDGGAITERVPKLECFEGRLQSYQVNEDGDELHQLEYHFSFEVADVGPPEVGQSSHGRVVVIGNDANGKRIEIRGSGWIGYDGEGNVEGRFDVPPVIITEGPDNGEDEDDEEPTPLATSNVLDFPLPENYRAATIRVEGSEDDWED